MEKKERLNPDKEIDIIPILRALLTRLWLMILVGGILAVAVFGTTKVLIKPDYRSGFTAYVNNQKTQSSDKGVLHLAVIAAGIQEGDRVFCSDMTFCATVNPALYAGAVPVFIDSERETWNMDPRALEKAFDLYPGTKAVISVNLYGTPAKLDEIRRICDRHGAVLIEDAAESFGASFHGKQTGSFGSYNVISFNGNKIITGSTGGCFLTDDEQTALHIRKLATQAKEPASWYQHNEIGYNYRISNIVAGVIRGQMPELWIQTKEARYLLLPPLNFSLRIIIFIFSDLALRKKSPDSSSMSN